MNPVIVHVNQHVIKHNAKHGTSYPTLTCKLPANTPWATEHNVAARTIYCHKVNGVGSIIDSAFEGRKALHCGARVWMEMQPDTFNIEGPWLEWETLRERIYVLAGGFEDTPRASAEYDLARDIEIATQA